MDLERLDDAALVAQIADGDAAAFAALVRRHQRAVVAVALCVTRSQALAEELAQEAFVKAWRNAAEVREPAKVAAWLCGVVRFLARDHVRLEARRAALQARYGDDSGSSATPAEELDARGRDRLVATVLAELPETYREPLLLHYLGGHSFKQVASVLELTEDAVKQRLSRGRRALRIALERLGHTEAGFAGVVLGLAPGPAFTRATVVEATGHGPPTTHAEETFMQAHRWKVLGLALAITTAGGLALAVTARGDETRTPTPDPTTASSGSSPATAVTVARRAGSRKDLAAQLRAIRAARAARIPAAAGASASGAAEAVYDFAGETLVGGTDPAPAAPEEMPTAFNKAGIRRALAAVRPLVRACYDDALTRDSTVAGTIAIHFVLEGEAGLPAAVSESGLDEAATTIADGVLRACVVDAMLALEVPAPDGGRVVRVHYPYVLQPAPR